VPPEQQIDLVTGLCMEIDSLPDAERVGRRQARRLTGLPAPPRGLTKALPASRAIGHGPRRLGSHISWRA
jgi:hypothetical protein